MCASRAFKVVLKWILWFIVMCLIVLVLRLIAELIPQIRIVAPWWAWLLIILVTGPFVIQLPFLIIWAISSAGLICPNIKIGNLLYLGFFLMFSVVSDINYVINHESLSALEAVMLLITDLLIVIGLLFTSFLIPPNWRDQLPKS